MGGRNGKGAANGKREWAGSTGGKTEGEAGRGRGAANRRARRWGGGQWEHAGGGLGEVRAGTAGGAEGATEGGALREGQAMGRQIGREGGE